MFFEPDEQQQMIRDMVRSYAREELAPKALWRDETSTFPEAEYRQMAGLGLLGMNIPEEFGGAAVGVVAYSMAVTEIAYADASVAVGMSVTNMVAETLLTFGSPRVRSTYVPAICRGDAVAGAFALTEPGSGSDAGGLKTSAVRVGDEWVLNGTKQFITSADHAGVFVVWVRSEKGSKGTGGISAFAVPKDAPGLLLGKKENKMGLRGSSTLEVIFEDCRIPADHLLGEEGNGFRVAMMALDGGRIGISSQALGIGLAARDAARDYALQRRQFGRAIAEFQALQWKIADISTEMEASQLLVMQAAWLKEKKRPFTQEASMAKVYASEAANRACHEALQIHGGYGYVKEYAVERYYRDCRVTMIYEGTSEVQRMVIARGVLS